MQPNNLRSFQDLSMCADNSSVRIQSCNTAGDYYSLATGKCNSDLGSRMSTYNDVSNIAASTIQLTIVKGYNFFKQGNFPAIQLQPGDIFRLTQNVDTGRVAIDRSPTNANPENDYWLAPTPTTKQIG